MEYERLSGRSAAAAHPGRPSVVEFSGRKVIKDEVEAYLADLELTRRPARTVQSKRKYLGDFVGLIGKEFADEYRSEDVLRYKNKLQDEGFAPKTIDTRMMAIVTFFNRWLKIKLGPDAKDWPETHDNDPEPYTDEEAAKLEAASAEEINLLIRTFRQTGGRDMELAHLNDTDLLDSKEIYIREKPCSDCKDCRSQGNVWRPKTPKSTRKIPVGDALFAEGKRQGTLVPERPRQGRRPPAPQDQGRSGRLRAGHKASPLARYLHHQQTARPDRHCDSGDVDGARRHQRHTLIRGVARQSGQGGKGRCEPRGYALPQNGHPRRLTLSPFTDVIYVLGHRNWVLVLDGEFCIHGGRRQRPDCVLGDRGYDAAALRRGLRARHIVPWLALRRSEHGSGLGRWRWVVERTFAWLNQFRRLRVRYEKRADIHEAFLSLGCELICWQFLRNTWTTG